MRNISAITYLSLLIIFSGCSKNEDALKLPEENPTIEEPEEEPENEIYFTLNVSEDIIPEYIEEWVLIHDLNGNLMDYKMIQNGETVIFEVLETEIKSSYNITRFTRNLFSDGETSRYFLYTYTNIPKGSVWNYSISSLNTTSEVNPKVEGNFSLNVYNIPPTYHFSLSSLENIAVTGPYYLMQNTYQLSLPEVELFETSNYILSILDGNNELKYTYLENIQTGDNINLDYNQFLNFDKYVIIDLPNQDVEYTYLIDGLGENIDYPGNEGYEYQSNLFEAEKPTYRPDLKLGYLNMFSKFKTFFGITMNEDNYGYSFFKQGASPNAISIPEKPSYNISIESMDNLTFSTNMESQYYILSWRADQETGRQDPDLTYWQVYSNMENNTVMTNMPEEIRSKYPTLNIEDLEFQSVNMYLEGETYNEYLDREFISNYSNSNMEYTREIITIY